jgi:hypothetical protein
VGVTAKFTIVQFDSSGGVVNRVDTGGQTFTLTGKLSPQGNSVIDGKQTRIVPGGNAASPNPYMLTW